MVITFFREIVDDNACKNLSYNNTFLNEYKKVEGGT